MWSHPISGGNPEPITPAATVPAIAIAPSQVNTDAAANPPTDTTINR